MKRLSAFIAGLLILALIPGSYAQQPVTVIGPVTPGNCAAFNSNTVIKDGGACGGGGGLGTMAFQNADAVAITGGTITGLGLPVISSDAANKQYVDNSIVGLIIHSQALLATAAALPANTYNNGASGVGATLTGNSNGALTVDGVLTATSNRIVVKNEAAPANNGIYTVTTVGTGGTPYVLTRATDANTPGTSNPAEIGFGTYVFVTSGTANADTGWSVTSAVTTIGTSAINWAQFSVGGGAAGNPGGSNGQVQYNNSGAFGGIATGTSGYALMSTGAAAPSYVGFTQSGTGAVARTWQSKASDWLNAKDFGVVCDGSTNDAVNINKAIVAANTASTGTTGGIGVQLPSGVCVVGVTQITLMSNVILRGAGQGATTLRLLAPFSNFTVQSSSTASNLGVADLTFDEGNFIPSDFITQYGAVFFGNTVSNCFVDHISIIHKRLAGVAFQGATSCSVTNSYFSADAIQPLPTMNVSAKNNNGSGAVRLTVGTTVGLATNNSMTVVSVSADANGLWAVTVVDGTHLDLQGSTFNAGTPYSGTGGTVVAQTQNSSILFTGTFVNADVTVTGNTAINSQIEIGATNRGIISGNHVTGYGFGAGIALEGTNSPTVACYNLTVTGNVLIGGVGVDTNFTFPSGIESGCQGSVILGNVLSANSGDGIKIEGSFNTIVGNTMIANNQNGIYFQNTSATYAASTNQIGDNVISNNTLYAVDGNNGTFGSIKNYFSANQLTGNSSGLIGPNVGIVVSEFDIPVYIGAALFASSYSIAAGPNGVSCSGSPTGSFTVTSGIVTHC